MIVMMVEAMVMIKCSNLEKKERKTKWGQGKGIFDRAIVLMIKTLRECDHI
jgi:hypothetical protein